MFYNFNIPYPNACDATELRRIEKILDRVHSISSKSVIALNLTVQEKLMDVKPIEPVVPVKFKGMQQLTRATLIVEDPKRNYQLAVSSTYPNIDILAVRPTTMDVCKHACSTLEVDLISLDLAGSKVLPGFVSAQVAVNRGIFFEICYSQSFREPNRKYLFYNNVKRLVEVTRGHNLIFSSEAIRALEIRRPADLKILGSMFGLTRDQIETMVNVNYCRLLKKTETRKLTYNATIGIEPAPVQSKDEATNNKRKNDNSAQNGKSKKIKK
ncbi:unnamed protein product [Mucor hiemalis]